VATLAADQQEQLIGLSVYVFVCDSVFAAERRSNLLLVLQHVRFAWRI